MVNFDQTLRKYFDSLSFEVKPNVRGTSVIVIIGKPYRDSPRFSRSRHFLGNNRSFLYMCLTSRKQSCTSCTALHKFLVTL